MKKDPTTSNLFPFFYKKLYAQLRLHISTHNVFVEGFLKRKKYAFVHLKN